MKDENKTKKELIRELKELRQSMADSQKEDFLDAKFRFLLEQLPVVVYVADFENPEQTLYISPQIESFWGYSVQDYMADPDSWKKSLHPEDRDRVLAEIAAWSRSGESFSQEYRIMTADGRAVWVRDDARVVKDESGGPLYLQGLMYDITDLKNAEHALIDQIIFLQTLMDTIPDPIFYKDAEGVYMGCNRAFEKALGLSKSEVVGRSVFDVSPDDLARKYYEMDRALLQSAGEQNYEAAVAYADGSHHNVIFSKAAFRNSEGRVAGLVGVMLDITERKKAEEALNRAHQELEQRVQERTHELALANEELKKEIDQRARAEEGVARAAENLKIFAYSIVHDLKSPTIGIYGLARNLKKHYGHVLDERGAGYCERILKASEHVAELVQKINTFIAAKESPLSLEKVRIEEILNIVREEFSTTLTVRQIEWFEPENAGEIQADRVTLLRVFRNLVDNALKYGGEQMSEIRIDYRETDDFHIFSVTDNGVGLQTEDSQRIFEVFKREQSSKGVVGAGLGLAIVREAAERHGGGIWVETKPGERTTFYFSVKREL